MCLWICKDTEGIKAPEEPDEEIKRLEAEESRKRDRVKRDDRKVV